MINKFNQPHYTPTSNIHDKSNNLPNYLQPVSLPNYLKPRQEKRPNIGKIAGVLLASVLAALVANNVKKDQKPNIQNKQIQLDYKALENKINELITKQQENQTAQPEEDETPNQIPTYSGIPNSFFENVQETQTFAKFAEKRVELFSGFIEDMKERLAHFHHPANLHFIKTNASQIEKKFGLNRPQSIQEAVLRAYKSGKLSFFNNEEKAQILSDLLVGIATQESKFNPSAKSNKNARGIFQITSQNWIDNVRQPNRKNYSWHLDLNPDFSSGTRNFYISLLVAINTLDKRIPARIQQELEQVKNLLSLDDKTYVEFSALCIVNAYNTGAGTMEEVLIKFIKYLQHATKKENVKDLIKSLTGIELYNIMREYAFKYRWSPSYRHDSSNYVPSVLAGANFIEKLNLAKLRSNTVSQTPMQTYYKLTQQANTKSVAHADNATGKETYIK